MKDRRMDRSRDGSVMLVVMLICGILMLASAAMVALASNASMRMRRQLQSAQALNIAEAGIADMIGRLSADYVAWQDSTNSASFGGGRVSRGERNQPGWQCDYHQ